MHMDFPNARSWLRRLRAAMLAVALLTSAPVGASLIISVGNVSSNSPSSNNTLEVDVTNTGPASLVLGGFFFEITVADTHITFTSATTATVAPYVFAGNSTFGPTISLVTGQTLDASDLAFAAGGVTVAAGATMGLGHVFFDVSAGALPGLVAVTLSPAFTTLADAEGNAVTVDTFANGSITIAGLAVPEPSALALTLLGLLLLASIRRRSWG